LIIEVNDPSDPALSHYTNLKDIALRSLLEPAEGLYMAESSTVIRRALQAGHQPYSLLMAHKWLPSLAEVIAALPSDTPVFVGPDEVLEAITGFHLHRGALAAMKRPTLPTAADLIANTGRNPSRIAVFENIVDHTNLGAAFRSAAALGVDAVLVTPSCADPWYRRAIRVSMGTVFQVPWARLPAWPQGIELLREAGFTVAALALSETAITLAELTRRNPPRLALVLGTEGDGLSPRTIAAADVTVRIPMAHGVDSLNVAAASAVAFYATALPGTDSACS